MLIDTRQEPPEPLMGLHGHGGVQTALRGARNTVGKHGRATPPQALEVLRALSKVGRDQTMAATRNRWGSRTGTGKPWRAQRVAWVRYQYRLPHFPTAHDWLTLAPAAAPLGVRATGSRGLLAPATLPASQGVPSAPWMI